MQMNGTAELLTIAKYWREWENPQLIVLGGLCGRIFPFVDVPLRGELDRLALRASCELVEVVPSSLGADAPLLGAAELAFDPFLADPIGIALTRSAPGRRRQTLRVPA